MRDDWKPGQLHSTYKGCNILRSTSALWRWEAFVPGAGTLYANTLDEIRALITESLELGGAR